MSATDPVHGQHLREEVADEEHLLAAQNVKKYFPVRKGLLNREVARVHAVDDVTLSVKEGETLGLVGESGCGKSTFGRCLVRLLEPTAGTVEFQGRDITHLGARSLRPLRRQMQIIFQDPYASLNPRKRVGSIIADPLRIHDIGSAGERKAAVQELMEKVGLQPEHYNRFPHEFSGGQRQRIGVARALALQPKLIVADEPVSALDVSIQAQIVNLLDDLQSEFRLTYIFIAHDLGVVRHVSDRIAVMYLGKVVELSPGEELYRRPIHPYTEALLSAVPIPDPDVTAQRERILLEGDVPNPISPPPACRFHPRCRYATDVCKQIEPPLVDYGGGHYAACHHPRNVTEAMVATAIHDGAEVQEPSGTGNVLGGAATAGDGNRAEPAVATPAARPEEGRGADVPGGIGSEADPQRGRETTGSGEGDAASESSDARTDR